MNPKVLRNIQTMINVDAVLTFSNRGLDFDKIQRFIARNYLGKETALPPERISEGTVLDLIDRILEQLEKQPTN